MPLNRIRTGTYSPLILQPMFRGVSGLNVSSRNLLISILLLATLVFLSPGCGGGGKSGIPYEGPVKGPYIPVFCGDKIIQAGEACDDGNLANGDGCDSACQFECGNGKKDAGEECDDGNRETEICDYGEESCQVCNSSCKLSAGITWFCGNGTLDGLEECDDGNRITESCAYGETSCEVCAENCLVETIAGSYCGDGTIDTSNGESCDDGNAASGDGCDVTCQLEVRISAGVEHTCALTTSGGVKCWGSNRCGQLGDGTTTDRYEPVDVTGLTSGVVSISVGEKHTCALTEEGGAKCWGANYEGQLGDGTTIDRYEPVDVMRLTSGVVEISAGSSHTCALMTDGGVKCWGPNSSGELGDGTTARRRTPVDVKGLSSGAVSISAGYLHTCAITNEGGMKCWGSSFVGQLGDGENTRRLEAVEVKGLSNGVKAISAGATHTCAVLTEGSVKCWGENHFGELGDSTTTSWNEPTDVLGLTSGVSSISAGENYTCAITSEGGVKCWGKNDVGQLGDGTTTDRHTPIDVSEMTNGAITISSGAQHTCAYMSVGKVKCWGESSRLGDGPHYTRYEPADVSKLTEGVEAVSVGRFHTCAITSEGGAKCWGYNEYGQLGDGTASDRLVPVDVMSLSSGAVAISSGEYYACAITSEGGVKCWGSNGYGQLGDGTTTDKYIPTDVSGLTGGVTSISYGGSHACAITSEVTVKCWGTNYYGQLGDGTTTGKYIPTDVSGLTDGAVAISAGGSHTCAITSVGGAKCWGDNQYGQLGDGTTTRRYEPRDVSGLTGGVAAISAGERHTCALMISGEVKCWGDNLFGQLGDGTRTKSYEPVNALGLSNGVIAISSGVSSTPCAITSEGGVKCWGGNGSGQLGDGTTTNRYEPVDIRGLDNGAVEISTGVFHSCAVTAAGGAKCWGNNGLGALGLNPGWTPVDVVGF